MVPSGRVIVPSNTWLTPLPACGAPVTMRGGQAAAHAPEHADVPVLSASNRYKVRPPLPTRTLPGIPEIARSDTVAAPAACAVPAGLLALALAVACDAAGLEAAGLEAAGPEAAGPELLELLEQAATAGPIAAAPAALVIQFLIAMLP